MTPMSYEESILKRKLTFPEVLIYGNKYNTVSSDGKIAYIILYNQLEKALQENWIDEQNHVYFKFNYGEMSELFHWTLNKTKDILSELEIKGMVQIASDPELGIIQRTYLAELSL
ncbi:replication initiator protein A [Pediococcus pentosaceus]|jgi:ubiquinone biosynthesis protein Coq4|nr:replication initiator protein A [Pediococcus pentosaceus]MCV3320568.1 replication initiator protein A [Pediococcus pentosaceus]MCV3330454.1 replication initiator protein A [Pediococcus pentosaceus]